MNGAGSVIRTALGAGVELCLANPGTTEMHLVAALDAAPRLRSVLALFEGVVTGAADGYARLADRPALALLHLGPGLANGLANLHNARRAASPVVVLVGDHARAHLAADPPLASDIDSLARPVSRWLRTAREPGGLGRDTAEAIAAALAPPGGVSTLVIPADCAWGEGGREAAALRVAAPARVPGERVEAVARALRSRGRALLLLGGRALRQAPLRRAASVARGCGARLGCEAFAARIERGADLPAPEKMPYFPEQVAAWLEGLEHLVLVGARAPVAFFAYPDTTALIPGGCTVWELAGAADDASTALEDLDAALGSTAAADPTPPPTPPTPPPDGPLTTRSLGAALAALQPEGAVVMDEGGTSGPAYWRASTGAPRHTYLSLTGGSIGQGLPCATGAALACPDRTVIALQADGSGMYTPQALWTQAREGLDVKTVVCANRQYRILRIELGRAGIAQPGPASGALCDLGNPVLDWVALARGLGVPAERARSAEQFRTAFGRALSTPGPYLVEAVLD
jgi:acetolactate synthase-1/2/3 large subunit